MLDCILDGGCKINMDDKMKEIMSVAITAHHDLLKQKMQALFEAKMGDGQLAKSDLTFCELETIKNAFVRVLAGYYHSRIEYPNQKEPEVK